jgi:Crinkler effector protein N-terminal domain
MDLSKVSHTDSPPQLQATASLVIPEVAHLAFWCLLEGSSTVFEVKIPANANIWDLKKAIKLEKKIELGHVDADQLLLWKVWKLYSASTI